MTVRALLRMGDPLLRQLAQPVMDCQAPRLVELVADLQDTMEAHSGAGLAAPQIGIPLRVVIFGGGGPNLRYPDAPPGAVYGLRWSVVGAMLSVIGGEAVLLGFATGAIPEVFQGRLPLIPALVVACTVLVMDQLIARWWSSCLQT
jgi:hypothetical protein